MRQLDNPWTRWAQALGSALPIMLSLCGLATPLVPPTPTHQPAPSVVFIDWVNFLQLGDIQYLVSSVPGQRLTSSALGRRFAQVRHKLEGNVHDAGYQPHNGDAAFLDAGTPVYLVKGYRPRFRLAVRWHGTIELFEADTNPHAHTGADLLDIGGKVRAIAVTSLSAGDSRSVVIRQPQQIAALVAMILRAPVNQQRTAGPRGWTQDVAFSLADGTRVIRSFDASSGLLERGILLPPQFARVLRQAGVPGL